MYAVFCTETHVDVKLVEFYVSIVRAIKRIGRVSLQGDWVPDSIDSKCLQGGIAIRI